MTLPLPLRKWSQKEGKDGPSSRWRRRRGSWRNSCGRWPMRRGRTTCLRSRSWALTPSWWTRPIILKTCPSSQRSTTCPAYPAPARKKRWICTWSASIWMKSMTAGVLCSPQARPWATRCASCTWCSSTYRSGRWRGWTSTISIPGPQTSGRWRPPWSWP